MILEQRTNVFRPIPFQGLSILGTTQSWQIDQTYPLEEILIIVSATLTANVLTPNASPTTIDQMDALMGIVKNVNLSVNDSKTPRSVVNYSGMGLLELCAQLGLNLDASTWAAASAATYASASQQQIAYRIPMVNPQVGEDLRTRSLLPIHLYQQPPTLNLTFNAQANLGTSAGTQLANVAVDVVLVRRKMTAAVEAQIGAKGGYVQFDLIEQLFSVPLGSAAPIAVPLLIPGEYANLLVRHYLGGTTLSRSCIDGSGIGAGAGGGFGAENLWTLETGGYTIRQFTWKTLRVMNQWTRTLNNTSSPDFGSGVIAGSNVRSPASVMFDFLGDGVTQYGADELGSLLDCNSVSAANQKMEIKGIPASVATNASVLLYGGYRYTGDITRFQKYP